MASSLQIIVGPATHTRTYTASDGDVADVVKDAMRGDLSAVERGMVDAGLTPPLDFGDNSAVAEAFTAWITFRVKRHARSFRRAQAEEAATFTEPQL